ncbi:MAG TPA: hypothetical protein VNY31_03435 [Solirubrobacteraceae bacterium]|jgi:hypothetical protein|nr:hypothetical protein [Solirubrobacteraceae bacterium]
MNTTTVEHRRERISPVQEARGAYRRWRRIAVASGMTFAAA